MAANFQTNNYQKYFLNFVALYNKRPDLKAYTEILLSIVTIGIFIVFAIKPTLVTIAELITKINEQQQTSDNMDTKIKNLGIAQNLYTREQSNINLLNQAVPSGPDVANYVRQIEGVMKKENITPLTMSVDQVDVLAASTSATPTTATPPNPASASITISMNGTYAPLLALIEDIESLRRPASLSKLSFSVSQVDKNTQVLNLTLSAHAPFEQ